MKNKLSRQFPITTLAAIVVVALCGFASELIESGQSSDKIIDIDSRLELFVDKYLIGKMINTTQKLHEPQLATPMNDSMKMEYGTIIKDGNLFRLYSREGRGAKFDGDTSEVTRYWESRDGIHWTNPKLGLFGIDGSKANNVILHEAYQCHNFAPFLDSRVGVDKYSRFKALAGVAKGGGLFAYVSGDGIHWKKLKDKPVIRSDAFAFDSQNVSFWSESEQCYVCYFRSWEKRETGNLRSISRTTSKDFCSWSEAVPLHPNLIGEHLYTSQAHPYFRAPQIYIATPTRFFPDRGESTDILFMTSRGNSSFDRSFLEAFIRPGLDPARWGNRSNYAVLNVVPTGAAEMSVYTTPFRRFTLRTDGFVSVNAGAVVGEFFTKFLRFSGNELFINFSTSGAGSIRIEIQDVNGKPIPGYSAGDCQEIIGDKIEQVVQWIKNPDLSKLAGQPLRLRFIMKEADLYAIQFRNN
jgi:hypothetical protein